MHKTAKMTNFVLQLLCHFSYLNVATISYHTFNIHNISAEGMNAPSHSVSSRKCVGVLVEKSKRRLPSFSLYTALAIQSLNSLLSHLTASIVDKIKGINVQDQLFLRKRHPLDIQ